MGMRKQTFLGLAVAVLALAVASPAQAADATYLQIRNSTRPGGDGVPEIHVSHGNGVLVEVELHNARNGARLRGEPVKFVVTYRNRTIDQGTDTTNAQGDAFFRMPSRQAAGTVLLLTARYPGSRAYGASEVRVRVIYQ